MDNILRITLVQTDLQWNKKEQNKKKFQLLLKNHNEDSDIIVLPEMFTTGFSMDSEKLAESENGSSLQWMKEMALQKQSVVVGSIIISENNEYFNRLYWVYPNGKVLKYDKRHLFRMAEEHKHYTAGKDKLIVEYKGWKICPLICYDLRFPVWSRNTENYDLLIYIANWPERRSFAWKTLLLARAIENQVYVAAVNRIGKDKNTVIHSGDSLMIDPLGSVISNIKPHKEIVQTISISLSKLNKFRTNFPVSLDADSFTINT